MLAVSTSLFLVKPKSVTGNMPVNMPVKPLKNRERIMV
jgi:hypothetical protein